MRREETSQLACYLSFQLPMRSDCGDVSEGAAVGAAGPRSSLGARWRTVLDGASALIALDYHARGRHITVFQLPSTGDGAVLEEPLPGAEDHWEDPQIQLVDEVVLEQGLKQVPASDHMDRAPGLLFQLGDGRCGVTLEQLRVLPFELLARPRRYVLRGTVERGCAGQVAVLGPVAGEDVVGLSAQEERFEVGQALVHDMAHFLVPVRHGPSSVPEAAVPVLVRTARRLHDAVQREESLGGELPRRLGLLRRSLARLGFLGWSSHGNSPHQGASGEGDDDM